MFTVATLAPTAYQADARLLPRCLLLALLVHVWLALMIGTKPGPSHPGRGGFGSLSVTLRGPSGSGLEAEAAVDTPVWRDDGPLGEARSSRHGGRLRQQAPPPDSGPGAAELGRWRERELPPEPSRPDEESAGALGAGALEQPAAEPTQPPAPPAEATLRQLPQTATPRAQTQRLEPLAALPAVDSATLPRPPLLTVPESTVLSLPATVATTRPVTVDKLEALQPGPPVAALRTLPTLPEPEATTMTLPAAPPLPTRRRVEAIEALKPQQSATRLAPLPALAEAETELRALPQEPATALRRPRLAAVERLAPSSAAAASKLRPAPELPTLPDEPTLKTLSSTEPSRPRQPQETISSPRASLSNERIAPLPQATALPDPPAQSSVDTPAVGSAALDGASPSAPLTRGDPLANPQPGPRASAGSPDAGARVGHDVATAPSASASAPLAPLNLNLPRANAAAARRSAGLLELLPALPVRKSKLEQAVDEAKREDCRNAHGDKGLLGAVPLAIDSARGKGCKW